MSKFVSLFFQNTFMEKIFICYFAFRFFKLKLFEKLRRLLLISFIFIFYYSGK